MKKVLLPIFLLLCTACDGKTGFGKAYRPYESLYPDNPSTFSFDMGDAMISFIIAIVILLIIAKR